MNPTYHRIFGVVALLSIVICFGYVVYGQISLEQDQDWALSEADFTKNTKEGGVDLPANPVTTVQDIDPLSPKVAVANPKGWNLQQGPSCNYYVQGGKVFFSDRVCLAEERDVPSKSVPIEIVGADPSSFIELFANQGATYAKDKNGIYKGADRILPEADPQTFTPTTYMSKNGFPRYFLDKAHLFRERHEGDVETFEIVPNADPATFTIFEITGPYDVIHLYAKDKNQFYCEGAPVSHIDPDTVTVEETPSGNIVIKDKNGEYRSYYSYGELYHDLGCPKI